MLDKSVKFKHNNNAIKYNAIQCTTMQYNAIPCNTMQDYEIPYNKMLA